MASASESSEGKLILVIEDSVDLARILSKLLELEGYLVACATNGKEALEVLERSKRLPNLILLDIMMPVMNGFEFREAQMQNPRFAEIPVVVMTAHQDVKTAQAQIGALGSIKKPPEIDEILSVVKTHAK